MFEKSSEKNVLCARPHTNAHAIYARPTPKDDGRFQNGLVHEFHSSKVLKTLKEVNISDVKKTRMFMSRTLML